MAMGYRRLVEISRENPDIDQIDRAVIFFLSTLSSVRCIKERKGTERYWS